MTHRRAKPPAGYTDRPAEREVTWTPVICPEPVFDGGPAEKARFEEAIRTVERLEAEDVCDWLERVARAAGAPLGDRELPAGDRDRIPGEDDDTP